MVKIHCQKYKFFLPKLNIKEAHVKIPELCYYFDKSFFTFHVALYM